MQMYIGITDTDWYQCLRKDKCDEVNFWTPGSVPFRALAVNEMFLFKLHSPQDYIVGGGFFVEFSVLPTSLVWETFGKKNGARDYSEFISRILKYRRQNDIRKIDFNIGNIILADPFYFDEQEWIPVPGDWSKNIVRGKKYNTNTEIGKKLYLDVLDRLNLASDNRQITENRYAKYVAKHRLGQGGFRVLVTDAYQRRCAITGEKTLPVLQAAHIRPYSFKGPHDIRNGILLRSDLHTLFDEGYITIDDDYRIDVSDRLHQDYGNGKDYYKYKGKKLLVLPNSRTELPAKEFIDWHNDNIYLG